MEFTRSTTKIVKSANGKRTIEFSASSLAKKKDLIDLFLTSNTMTPKLILAEPDLESLNTVDRNFNLVQKQNDFSWKLSISDVYSTYKLNILLHVPTSSLTNFTLIPTRDPSNGNKEISLDEYTTNTHVIYNDSVENFNFRNNYYGYAIDNKKVEESIKAYNILFNDATPFTNNGSILVKSNGDIFLIDKGKIVASHKYKDAFMKFVSELLEEIQNDVATDYARFEYKINSLKDEILKSYAIIESTVGFYDEFLKNLHKDLNAVQSPKEEIQEVPNIKQAEKSYHEQAMQIIEEYKSYSVDLVKMMKLPLMIDLTEPIIKELNTLVKSLELDFNDGDFECSKDIYIDLDSKFTAALRVAQTTKLNRLTSSERKKIKDAETILNKAIDPASPDHEKNSSVKALISNLNGILPIGEESIVWLKAQTGLSEISA